MTEARSWDFGPPVSGYHWRSPRRRASLLLQHGYGEYTERFVTRYDELIPSMLDRGIDVYAFDLPGHGRSPGRRGDVDVVAAAEIHRAAKDALRNDGPVLLFGHSLGGLITAHTVAVDPVGIAGAVLSSPALPTNTGRPLRALASVLSAIAPHARVPLPAAPPETLSRSPENAELIAADPLMHGRPLTNRTAHSALRAAAEIWQSTPTWNTPTLILHGTADRSTDPWGSVRLAQALEGRAVDLDLLADGRHELLNDTDRRRVRQRVLGWLDDHVDVAADGALND